MSGSMSPGKGFPGFSFSSRLRLILGVFLISWLLFFSLLAWFFVRGSLHEQVDTLAINQIHAAADNLDDRLENLEITLITLAKGLAYQWDPKGNPPPFASRLLRSTLDGLDPDSTAGLFLACEALPAKDPNSFIWFRHPDRESKTVIPGEAIRFDFHNNTPLTSWYHRPRETKKPFLTEPYFDLVDSKEKVVSMSVPVIDGEGVFRGVVGLDIRIEAIEAVRRKLKLYTSQSKHEGSFQALETGFICSPQGRILAHPDSQWLPTAQRPFGFPVEGVPLGEYVAAKPEGYEIANFEGQSYRITWTTSPKWGWKLVLMVPETVINEPVRILGLELLVVFLIGSAFIFILVSIIARKMSEPLTLLQKSAQANSTQSPMVHALALRNDEIGMVVRWLLRLSEHASEQDDRNRVELMRAFRLELARQLAGVKLEVGKEATTWGPERLAEELQSSGYPVEPGQIQMSKGSLVPGEQKVALLLSDDICQEVLVVLDPNR